jgi:hypothetical protein
LATRLLNAGHPLHAVLPPVPSQCPSPGHVPRGVWEVVAADAMTEAAAEEDSVGIGNVSFFIGCTSLGGVAVEEGTEVLRFKVAGRDVCLAFSYNPQALHIIFPLISRRHSGVEVVPQFLNQIKFGREVRAALSGY